MRVTARSFRTTLFVILVSFVIGVGSVVQILVHRRGSPPGWADTSQAAVSSAILAIGMQALVSLIRRVGKW